MLIKYNNKKFTKIFYTEDIIKTSKKMKNLEEVDGICKLQPGFLEKEIENANIKSKFLLSMMNKQIFLSLKEEEIIIYETIIDYKKGNSLPGYKKNKINCYKILYNKQICYVLRDYFDIIE